MDPDLGFRLLGPLEVLAGGEHLHVGGARQRIVLSMLLLEPGRVVPVDRLIEAIWDDEPPATARSQIQIAISELRRRLAGAGGADLIATHPAGYLLRVPDDAIDVARFQRFVATGRQAVRDQDLVRGTAVLRAALACWRGAAAGGVDSRLVRAAAVRLDEERLTVAAECIDLDLALGRHLAVIGELRELLSAHPLQERLYGQLMLALYRAGRQAEALGVYRGAHRLLVEEYGLSPGERLRELERAILANDPALDLPVAAPEWIVPRQLPAALPDFVGRDGEVARMGRCLTGTGEPPGEARLAVVTGPAGVGKTTLAVNAAHAVSDRFPDGQLFAHLRGTGPHPAHPAEVLEQFLRALGLAPALLPATVDELSALYRSRLAEQRMLVVLDDAAGAEQVLPLIPGGIRCGLVITSRRALPRLPGAHRFDLDVFEPDTSAALLARVIGERRVRAEAAAAAALAESCGHLPLALRIAAAKLSVRQHWQIGRMVSRLNDERRRLDELTLDGVGVRASISTSYRGLEGPACRLLLLLGMLGAETFAGWVAGPLLDADAGYAADLLDGLVEARLVDANADNPGRPRYRLHDLVRLFAQESLAREVPAAARAQAQRRLLRCWLFLARAAHRREYGGVSAVLRSGAQPWRLPTVLVDEVIGDPIEWFQAERSNLVAATSLAGELDHDELCWELAMLSVTAFESQADRDAWRYTHQVALAAARRAGNQRAEAAMRYSRAALAIIEHRMADARADLEPALAWFTQAGDVHGCGLVLRHLAFSDRLAGRYDQATQRYEAALAELRKVGDHAAAAHVLGSLAQIHLDHGRLDPAERLLREALAICDRVNVRRVAAQVHNRLGHLHLERGDLAQAEAAFAAVRQAVATINDPTGWAYAWLGAGSVRLAMADLPAAKVALQKALETMRQTGHRLGVGRCLLALADVAMRSGDRAAAVARLAEAEEVFTQIGAKVWCSRVADLRDRLPPTAGER